MRVMSAPGDGRATALTELRQLLRDSSVIDRRVLSRSIFATAYGNPRTARPLVQLLHSDGRLSRSARRRLSRTLSMLTDIER